MPVPYINPLGYGNTYGYPQPFNSGLGITTPASGNQNGLIISWVQGINAMKSFAMGPNQKAFLFNTEENNFGIKSTDANGMPYPLEIFRYERETADTRPQQTPSTNQSIDTSVFVTREELEARIASIMRDFESHSDNNQNNQNQNRGDQKHGK